TVVSRRGLPRYALEAPVVKSRVLRQDSIEHLGISRPTGHLFIGWKWYIILAVTVQRVPLDIHYTLRQLQYFVAVSQARTLNEAASRCHVSPPALSLAISQLERSLGVKLLVRHRSKGTELTSGGARVLELAESLLAQARQLQENADAESGGNLDGSL